MAYETIVSVRFGDIDAAGIAYYPRIFELLHIAMEHWFEGHVGVAYPQLFVRERLGFPTVHVETDYKKPLRYGDRLRIEVAVGRIGRSSADLLFRAYRAGELCVASRQTIVCLDLDTFKAVPIPDRYRPAFERGMEPPIPEGPAGEA